MNYEKFEQLLRIKNTSVYRVSKETGIPASTFSDWKNGRSTPKTEKLSKIARFFDVSLDYFFGNDREIRPEKEIPIIGEIRAGSPIITNETLIGYERASVDSTDNYFYFHRNAEDSGVSRFKIVGGELDGSVILIFGNEVDIPLISAEALNGGTVSRNKTSYNISVIGILLFAEENERAVYHTDIFHTVAANT